MFNIDSADSVTTAAIIFGYTPKGLAKIGNIEISGDVIAKKAEPFTPSVGNLWAAPGVQGVTLTTKHGEMIRSESRATVMGRKFELAMIRYIQSGKIA